MNDLNQGGEPDIDSMSDEDFASFKSQMADGDREPPQEKLEPAKEEPQKAVEQDSDDDADDAAGDEQGGDKQETVPHGRFHRERERRKQLEQQIADDRHRYEVLEQRTAQLLQLQAERAQAAQPQQPQEQIPDRATDPLGYIEYMDKRIERFEQASRQQAEFNERHQQEQRLINEVTNRAATDFQQAIAEDPTYNDAYAFMFNTAVREKMAVEGLPEHIAVQDVQRQELGLYHQALQRGQRPSTVIMALAKARGWQPKAPEAEQPNIEQAAADIEKLNRAKDAAKSLSSAGSEARSGVPSPKDIVEMSDEDFAAFKAKHGENAMARVMGG